MTKHLTGCRHVQKSHDVVLHIPPSSSSNTSVKLLMIELTEHHLMIHILLAPIRRSTDPQAYVHNPNISQIYPNLTTVYSSLSMGAIQICRRFTNICLTNYRASATLRPLRSACQSVNFHLSGESARYHKQGPMDDCFENRFIQEVEVC